MYRLATLETAQQCLELGARPRTIRWLTGLSDKAVLRLTAEAGLAIPRGRPPYSEEFFHAAAASIKADISRFAADYERLVEQDVLPVQALISAYRHYCTGRSVPSFCFDQAFFIVACFTGKWVMSERSLFLRACGRCASRHLVSHPGMPTSWCPFCASDEHRSHGLRQLPREVTRRGIDSSVAAAAALEQRIQALRLQHELERLGASQRHVQILVGTPVRGSDAAGIDRSGLGKEMPVERWGARVKTMDRAMYAALACTYRLARKSGCTVEQALVSAFRHVSSLPGPISENLRFDKAFNVVAALDGRWGAERTLELVRCARCPSVHLVSLLEVEPAHCPFCQINRRPGLFGFR